MATNLSKSTSTLNVVNKGKQNVTWDEATFTWDEGVNSTWDGIGAFVTGDVSKSTTTVSNLAKS